MNSTATADQAKFLTRLPLFSKKFLPSHLAKVLEGWFPDFMANTLIHERNSIIQTAALLHSITAAPKVALKRSRPDAGYRLSTVLALPFLQVHLSDHVSRPLDDHLLARGAEGVLPLVTRHVSDIDILKAG